MIAGSPDQFSVELDCKGMVDGFQLGTISYVIGGKRVGDPEMVTLLGDYAMKVLSFQRSSRRRRNQQNSGVRGSLSDACRDRYGSDTLIKS